MRILVAGATGVIGAELLPLLREDGHEVVALATYRSPERAAHVPEAERVVADALDRDAVHDAVRRARPDVVVNLLTAIPAAIKPRQAVAQFAQTNRLRREGTHHLAEAADEIGAQLISESIAFMYAPAEGRRVVDEDAPLWLDQPARSRPIVEAVAELERATLQSGGTVLRFGQLYGPGTSLGEHGSMTADVRRRRLPIVGDGGALFSFVDVADAASAVRAAIARPQPGRTFNVVDDEPAEVAVWLPELATILGAPPPRRAPAAIARLFAGWWGVAFMTRLVGASNRRAREELGWTPRFASWRQGFRARLAPPGAG